MTSAQVQHLLSKHSADPDKLVLDNSSTIDANKFTLVWDHSNEILSLIEKDTGTAWSLPVGERTPALYGNWIYSPRHGHLGKPGTGGGEYLYTYDEVPYGIIQHMTWYHTYADLTSI